MKCTVIMMVFEHHYCCWEDVLTWMISIMDDQHHMDMINIIIWLILSPIGFQFRGPHNWLDESRVFKPYQALPPEASVFSSYPLYPILYPIILFAR